VTCPNCRFDAPETELCPNCGAALKTPASSPPVSAIEKTGAPGGCIAAILFNLAVFFGGWHGLVLLVSLNTQGQGWSCATSRVVLGVLAAVSVSIVAIALRRARQAGDFWGTFALGVFVPFLPCTIWIVSQSARC